MYLRTTVRALAGAGGAPPTEGPDVDDVEGPKPPSSSSEAESQSVSLLEIDKRRDKHQRPGNDDYPRRNGQLPTSPFCASAD